jgi:catechol 2,3-dioxygenase-like lactoylglutathione lyase family enzyme
MELLKFHHVGLLTDDIEETLISYRSLFGENNVSEKKFISSQNVYVCFVKVGDESYIELIQPANEKSVVNNLIKKGAKYYHIGYYVIDFNNASETLIKMDYKALPEFISEAFNQKRCQFFYTPDGSLIEIIER